MTKILGRKITKVGAVLIALAVVASAAIVAYLFQYTTAFSVVRPFNYYGGSYGSDAYSERLNVENITIGTGGYGFVFMEANSTNGASVDLTLSVSCAGDKEWDAEELKIETKTTLGGEFEPLTLTDELGALGATQELGVLNYANDNKKMYYKLYLSPLSDQSSIDCSFTFNEKT
jgi:hypothetical protein